MTRYTVDITLTWGKGGRYRQKFYATYLAKSPDKALKAAIKYWKNKEWLAKKEAEITDIVINCHKEARP